MITKKSRRKIPIAVILSPIGLEYASVKEQLKKWKEEVIEELIYEFSPFEGVYHKWKVYIREIGKGNVRAALNTYRAIDKIEPDLIILVGIAGGIKDVKLEDVIVVSKACSYESARIEDTADLPRAEVGYSSGAIIERAKIEMRKDDWKKRIIGDHENKLVKIHYGAIAAGEKLVATELAELIKFIKKNYSDTIAIDMEDFGFFEATKIKKVEALIIRGISDLLKKKAETDTKGTQQNAARNASAFTFEVLSKFKIK